MPGYLQLPIQRYNHPDTHVFFFFRVFGHSSFIGTVVPVITSVRFGKVGRTCRYVPTSQSLSSVRGVCCIPSLYSVGRRRRFLRCRYVPTLQSLILPCVRTVACRLSPRILPHFQINVKPNLQNGRFCCIFVLQGRNFGMAPRIFRLFSCLLPISARTERIFSTAVQDFLSAVPFFRSLRFARLGRFCFDGMK